MILHSANKLFYPLVPVVFALVTFWGGCEKNSPEIEAGLNKKLQFNSADYKLQLKNTFENIDSFVFADSSLLYADTLKHFYNSRGFDPQFIKSFENKELVDSVVEILAKAYEHGLNPNIYHVNNIISEFELAVAQNTSAVDRYKHLSKAELYLADGIIKYSYHMRFGALNPQKIFLESYYMPIPDSAKRDLFEPLLQVDLNGYLKKIQPKGKRYIALKEKLKEFESIKDIAWPKLTTSKLKITIGDSDSILGPIANRLSILGYGNPAENQNRKLLLYDSTFAEAIKNFQKAHGLIPDGVLSKNTLTSLNTAPEDYIKKIKINLERFRWFDYSDSVKYILVNIPDFNLYAIENGKSVFDIKVCTGRKRYANFASQLAVYKKSKKWYQKPEDWETPILYSQLSHLILNPTWTVPASIMREEISYKLKRDSAYLAKANFRVYKDGVRIDPAEVTLHELNSGNIPYIIIQDPGAGNALGKIKFMFDNRFGVYLHDTPTRAPFGYSNRAVSHGCVRVEKPFKLAEYLLANNSSWTIDFLKIEIGLKISDIKIIEEFKQKRSELRKGFSYGPTTEVKLTKSIPLFIDYYTAWVDENGAANFRDDVYRQDKIIWDNLLSLK